MSDHALKILIGDWVERLRELPENSFHCCVTSPPYWRLRDYGVSGQLGLEPTLEEYLDKMVKGFREVRRVLRKDGTLWLNIGDLYAGGGNGGGGAYTRDRIGLGNKNQQSSFVAEHGRVPAGFKTKDLIGLPWRVAFALQADGWYLRMDNIWHKPNPMPESVRDRTTRAHEYVFMFSKSECYYYDAEGIKEQVSGNAHARSAAALQFPSTKDRDHNRRRAGVNPKAAAAGSGQIRPKQNASFAAAISGLVSRRNKRSVWTVSAVPYRGAHFATFPPKLIEPCIRAGSSAGGCCRHCGAPYQRVIEKGKHDLAHQRACGGDVNGNYTGQATKDFSSARAQNASAVKARILAGLRDRKTIGWKSTCDCPAGEPVPCSVLDPFGGTGTTAQVALAENRRAVLIELNPDDLPMIEKRCQLKP